MKKAITILLGLLPICTVSAQDFESATTATQNITLGWNLGNTLDSNSGDVNNMWIEMWTDCTPTAYETAWGQPVTTPELIKMFKDAGFNAIRVPVTWYPHIDDNGTIDETWMARVKEVVDYVIDEDMYCIVNVHHDTGAATTHWLIADGTTYDNVKTKWESLWTNIATTFRDYGERLIFEAYNEMLDSYNSWCFASFATSNYYDATVAADAYDALNNYAQSFVDAVRATGGNNATRNLIVNTYAAASGEGTWSSHLSEPLTNLQVPTDVAENHIMAEVHMYPSIESGVSAAISSVTQSFNSIKTNLVSKGIPVIIGEWGTSNTDADESDYERAPEDVVSFAGQFVAKAKEYGYPTFMWMMLSDGTDRSTPAWTTPDVKDAMVKAYYGEEGYTTIKSILVPETQDGIYYDLMGRRVSSPSKGIYIQNGKKIVIK